MPTGFPAGYIFISLSSPTPWPPLLILQFARRNKNNACPPGFSTKESCSWWSTSITCEFNGAVSSSAIPVSARYNRKGSCTSDPTSPDQGGQIPSAGPGCGGDNKIGSRYTTCCKGGFGACDPYGWAELSQCAESGGHKVFDVRNPQGCIDASNGFSTNFQAQQWCKSTSSRDCWLPYQMNADGDCFPLSASTGWWDKASGWSANVRKGGNPITLQGAPVATTNFVNQGTTLPEPQLNTAAISGTGAVGLAAVVGLGVFVKGVSSKRTKKTSAEDVEMKEGAASV